MARDLIQVENSFQAYLPALTDLVEPLGMNAARMVQTVLISCEKTPKLLDCTRDSLIQSAMTAGVLGLEVDGVTGQGFLIPYSGKAQFQIGYKGYATIAARSGRTINGGLFREDDEYDYREGTGGFIHYKKALKASKGRKILAAWCEISSKSAPSIIVVMPYDDVLAIKAKSQGAKKADSPWNDMNGPGHAAMCIKTAARQGGRFVPMSTVQMAVALEDHQDMGKAAYLRKDGALIIQEVDGEGMYPQRQAAPDGAPVQLQPQFHWIRSDGTAKSFHKVDEWLKFVTSGFNRVSPDEVKAGLERNREGITKIAQDGHAEAITEVLNRLNALGGGKINLDTAVDAEFVEEQDMSRAPSPDDVAEYPPTVALPFQWADPELKVAPASARVMTENAIEQVPTEALLDKFLKDNHDLFLVMESKNKSMHDGLMKLADAKRNQLKGA